MPYVIHKIDEPDGRKAQWLAPAGSKRAYTLLPNARRFDTLEEAVAECCPLNERPFKVDR